MHGRLGLWYGGNRLHAGPDEHQVAARERSFVMAQTSIRATSCNRNPLSARNFVCTDSLPVDSRWPAGVSSAFGRCLLTTPLVDFICEA